MLRSYGLTVLILTVLIAAGVAAGTVWSAAGGGPYAGEEKRGIKTLSPDDIDDLLAGRGWGLAKAAELNGMPGPAHLLEMKAAIGLSAAQEEKIRAVFETMQAAAKDLGAKLVAGERDLNHLFRRGEVDAAEMDRLLDRTATIRRDLRRVHLAAHLETPAILSDEQIDMYNRLRGYDLAADPCAAVPAGHDPVMWKKHNGCS